MSSTRDSDALPVDPPIPVPDVPGADATVRGLPRRVDLTLRQRLIVDSSAVAALAVPYMDLAGVRMSQDEVVKSLRATAKNTSSWRSVYLTARNYRKHRISIAEYPLLQMN